MAPLVRSHHVSTWTALFSFFDRIRQRLID